MDATAPADELRDAAEKLRSLAAAATPGPWEGVVDDHGRKGVDASVWADSIGYYVTEKISSGERHTADAAYIAAMHPGVGLALAKWLDRTAEAVEQANEETLYTVADLAVEAIELAREINGTAR
ncbi:hypothetical protein [Streptomyces sp900116325]|uniref:hypothetical protein n=1 Tax=Streptomyces sp. 900116325 TaxID=3154295 RepID=UPI0033F32D09